MKINLLSHDNGVGLTQDVRIVKSILDKEHEVHFTDLRNGRFMKADINIFFEILDGRHYDNAKWNLFFPNPEWFWWPKMLLGIDLVLCKTKDAVKIYKRLKCETVYTSFTSEDRNLNITEKDESFLHTAGQSETKGTQTVFNAWKPEYPRLVFTKLKNYSQFAGKQKNIMKCFERMPFEVLRNIQNKCRYHVCTSEYEGFGHYIWEAKSCGGIVITTDGAPMNEMVTDGVDGFLVRTYKEKKMNFAQLKLIDSEALQEVIERTMNMSQDEKLFMQTESRLAWEKNDRYFRETLTKVINSFK
jgi:glycosyltransferase involved in cell wall biosynthesis